ncbi:MAG TPA: hypothetical protein VFZ65_01435 [Planctomycetota bacterium]|nr:hypothetical protein [Planctomycetota bacterium]
MITTTRSFLAAAILLPGLSLSAQNLLSYRPDGGVGAPARMFEFPCRSPAWSPALGGPGLVPGPFAGRARPFVAALGACTVDSTAGVMFTTNGLVSIQRTQYPRIGSSTGAAIPDLPIPAVVGQVTGMAVDPVLHHLFLTNGPTVFEVDPTAGMAVLASFPAAPLNLLAGLEYDPAQPGLVFAVTTAAEVATYNRGGGLISAAPPTYAWPGADAVGIAYDKSNVAGGDFYVMHANGQIYNHTHGVLHTTEPANQVGMVYLPSPVQLPSAGTCGGVTPTVSVSELVVEGAGGFGLEIDNLPAGAPLAVWGVQVYGPGTAPPVPPVWIGLPFACGDTLWPVPGMPLLTFTALGAGTSAVLPLPLPGATAGWTLLAQPLVFCPSSPCGFILPNAMQCEISRG